MVDFTLKIYKKLLITLLQAGYDFLTFEQFSNKISKEKFVILRHDVDLKAENSLATAKIEHSLGIRASYYFRVVRQSNKPEIIRQIAALGHEIGYHYEDLTLCKGNEREAIMHFEQQLAHFRQFYEVKTICMHGSPRSKIDNRYIWKSNSYHNFGIIGEPYFDVDFNEIFYLTDTGRTWYGERFNIRDKVKSSFDLHFLHTKEIVNALKNNNLPPKIMITTHPQRWTNNCFAWFVEFFAQNLKNAVKWLMIKGF